MPVLRAGPLTATWLPEDGMVGAFFTHEGEELLGQRGGLEAYREKGSAFGIPLLAPWANRLDGLRYGEVEIDSARAKLDGNGLPKDGVMAGRVWEVERAGETELVTSFESDPPVLAVFPFPHRLRVSVGLGPAKMTVRTELTPTGVVPVPVSFGWHPLFTLPGVPREEIEIIVPATRQTVLDARGIPTGAEQERAFTDGPLGDRTADDEYPGVAGDFVLRDRRPRESLHDSDAGTRRRELRVSFGAPDYPVGHLWAPEGKRFVAWEPMTAPTNALVSGTGLRHVTPGSTFCASFTVAVTAR